MKNLFKKCTLIIASCLLFLSCDSELDLRPEDSRLIADDVFVDVAGYKSVLAKLYAGLNLTGQAGPAGNGDIAGLDEGFSSYLRMYFYLQELTADTGVIAWADGTIQTLNAHTWTSGSEFNRAMYDRIFYQVAAVNDFLRQSTPELVAARGITGADADEIAAFRAEARFLRALSYWHALDLYGNVPFVTEADPVGLFLPEQINRADLFNWLETELLDLENEMIDARQNEYARADKAGVWILLAKLYLNAEVYIGQDRYTDCVTQCNKIINAGYSIPNTPYTWSFLADNDSNGAQNEVIFPVTSDGLRTQAFGLPTFLVHAGVGGEMSNQNLEQVYGINFGWQGLRVTPQFVELFPGEENTADGRGLFWTQGQEKNIMDIFNFRDGFAMEKFRNITSTGEPGSDPNFDIPDTDFPMFRLADVYLMYAEAVLRGGSGGDIGTATTFINELRERAYGDTSGNITTGDLTLNFVLDERARELYWENHRRTDMVRFNRFTQNSVWPFKSGVQAGAPSQSFRDVFPIPATDLGVNTNLTQNPGY
ncbi:MAG: RagB/SusD family nutrient uptake outer membrane protein [Flavobacteriaceae bacterium]|nr:RagB/SusD family nutrient uptake outer membrane protein [Flavobacteriaceae bacterium]